MRRSVHTVSPLHPAVFALALMGIAACVPLGRSVVPRELRLWLGEFTWRPQQWHCQRVGPAPPEELCFTERRTPARLDYVSVDRDPTGRVVSVSRGWSTNRLADWPAMRDSVLRVARTQAQGAPPGCATKDFAGWHFAGWRLPAYDVILKWHDGAGLAAPLFQVWVEATTRGFYVCGPVRRAAA